MDENLLRSIMNRLDTIEAKIDKNTMYNTENTIKIKDELNNVRGNTQEINVKYENLVSRVSVLEEQKIWLRRTVIGAMTTGLISILSTIILHSL